MNYKLQQYREWLRQNAVLSDPFSPVASRKLTFHLLLGQNYRVLTESNTKGQLFSTFLWLTEIKKEAKKYYGDKWIEHLFKDLLSQKAKPQELKNLLLWMMGITQKTAVNLGLEQKDYIEFLDVTISYFNELFSNFKKTSFRDDAWLLMMAGSATLNMRGSQKAKVGKQFERVFLKSLLSLLGFQSGSNYWMNIERDMEVDREADAEVETKRGRIRIEVALIAPGNQEVIEDKIGRVGQNGIVLFDKLGAKTRVYQTAENNNVKLVQIRNCHPLLDVYNHLQPLVKVPLNKISENPEQLRKCVDALPENLFTINSNSPSRQKVTKSEIVRSVLRRKSSKNEQR